MSVKRVEVISPHPAARYRETFAPGSTELRAGQVLPEGWEGVYFPFTARFDGLRPDGSPADDGVLPDFDLPRRMYAGEDTRFLQPLRIGDVVEQTTRLGTVVEKQGRSGRLVFADLVREYRAGGTLAIVSTWHDVFLRATTDAAPAAARPEPFDLADGWWRESLTLDTRHLFRFSALTFNTHRVHYDRSWARRTEGLEDLLVHGPLTRLLALDSALRRVQRPTGGRASSFTFRSQAPLFVDQPFTIAGRDCDGTTEVVVLGPEGSLAARGIVTW